MAESEQLPVEQAKAGDPQAWDLLLRRYQLPLYVYVCELVGNQQTSLDIVQDTFIAGVRHIGQLRENEKFAGWLFGIAHQKCLQLWRKERRAQGALDEMARQPGEFEDSPDDLLMRREQEAQFMKLLNELPLAHRSVLLLHFVEDFSLDEIAQITGAPLGTVKSRLHYAKGALRKLLEGQPQ